MESGHSVLLSFIEGPHRRHSVSRFIIELSNQRERQWRSVLLEPAIASADDQIDTCWISKWAEFIHEGVLMGIERAVRNGDEGHTGMKCLQARSKKLQRMPRSRRFNTREYFLCL